MSTPFPLEEQNELQGAGWNPWAGQPAPRWYSGMGFDEDNAYLGPLNSMALKPLGQATASGELLLAGAAHRFNAYAAQETQNVPVVGPAMKYEEERSAQLEQDAEQRVKALTPDPATTGAAVRTVAGLVSGGYRAAVGTMLGGPAGGAALLGSTEGAMRYKELREQGVSQEAAAESAGVTGVASGAGALIPGGWGGSLFSKVATGAAANVALGMGNRYADSKILEDAGYKDMADQERVWDGVGMLTDALLGGAFGGLAHLHTAAAAGRGKDGQPSALDQAGGRDAALTANLAMRDRASAPGAPIDPGSAETHAQALQTAVTQLASGEPVNVADIAGRDAAFVPRPEPAANPEVQELFTNALKEGGVLEEQRNLEALERSFNARLTGEPEPEAAQGGRVEPEAPETRPLQAADIPRAEPGKLSDEDRTIESRFAEQIAGDYEGMKARYAQLPDAAGGKILNTDTARELSPDYLADRTKSAAVHEPASWFIKRLYAEKLAQAPAPGEEPMVLFTAGGTGVGKSTAVSHTLGDIADRAQIVMDTNMNGEESSVKKIDQALEAEKEVRIAYVHREPAEALSNGALTRAMRQEREHGSGRTVPIEEHVKTHVGANEVIRHIAAHYAHDPRVSMRIIDNTRGPKGAQLIELENLPRLDYNRTRENASAALEKARAEGRISEAVYRGFRGAVEPAAVERPGLQAQEQGLGAAAGRQPEPQRAGQRSDQLGSTERVATATGRSIEIKPKLVEASDLVTSDRPEYPQELQPRQRGARVALEQQVLDIAQNLDPARLGASAEADRGAPITGPGNVVESGNGRVMALREVFQNQPERAAAYRKWLQSQGHDVSGFKEPVLVRERVTPMSDDERRAFTVEANQAATAALSPVERAQADARLLDAGALSQLRNGELSQAQNAPFVRAFLERLPQSERNELLNPDGTVSQAGVRRLQAAIIGKAYGGGAEANAVLGRMLESTDNDMRSTMGAMLDAAPAFARLRQAIEDGKIGKEYDLSRALTQAIEATAKIRESGQSVGEALKQGDFLTRRAPVVDALIKALYDKKGERLASREKVAQTLTNYADRALKQRLDQGMLFGDAPAAPEQLLLNEGAKEEAAQVPPDADMFGLRTPQGAAPRGPVATEVARQVLEQKPNLEIAGDDGGTERARAEMMGAEDAVKTAEERAPGALETAANCFGQRAA